MDSISENTLGTRAELHANRARLGANTGFINRVELAVAPVRHCILADS